MKPSDNFHQLFELGLQHLKQGSFQTAAECFQQALSHRKSLSALNNLALALHYQHRHQQAIKTLKQALTINPNHFTSLINLAGIYQNQRQLNLAKKTYLLALKSNPNSSLARLHLGSVYLQCHQPQLALKHLNLAQTQKPPSLHLTNLQASAYIQMNQPKTALKLLSSLKSKKDFSTLTNLGVAHEHLHQLNQAQKFFTQALKLQPNHPANLNNLGNVFRRTGKLNQALKLYLQALRLDPQFADAHFNLAVTYELLDRHSEAVSHYQQAIKANPWHLPTYFRLGEIYFYQNRFTLASRQFRQALKRHPQYPPAVFGLTKLHLYACNFAAFHRLLPQLQSLTRQALKQNQAPDQSPFFHLLHSQDQAENLQLAQAWSQDATSSTQSLSSTPFSYPVSSTLKVGYLSDGFRDFPTGHNLIGVIEHHQLKPTLYTYSKSDTSPFAHRFQKTSSLQPITPHPTLSAARLINRTTPDLLIDLKGFTRNACTPILALRPAKTQISWLGYPGTTGASFIDYILADPFVLPPSSTPYFSETPIYLPHSYRPTDNRAPISSQSPPAIPKQFSFIFAGFNLSYKITQPIFSLWLKLLRQIPFSCLWLYPVNRTAQKNLIRFASSHRITPQRLVFASKLPKAQHLARLKQADLALDTFPVNGHTTTVDCLWANLPVVALVGKHFASRVSASVLLSIGLSELITHTHDDYYQLSLFLARHPRKLKAIRAKLTSHRKSYPLFATARFTQNLEKSYLLAHNQCLTKNPNQAIFLPDPKPLISTTQPASS